MSEQNYSFRKKWLVRYLITQQVLDRLLYYCKRHNYTPRIQFVLCNDNLPAPENCAGARMSLHVDTMLRKCTHRDHVTMRGYELEFNVI